MLLTKQLYKFYNTEQIIVVLICRLFFNTSTKEEVQHFINTQTINWALFSKIVHANSISAFIHHTIVTHAISIDTTVANELKNKYQKNVFINFTLLQTTIELANSFKEAGIKAIPYKGVLVAQRYYSNIALRENIDIDFLLKKEDVWNAENLLVTKGCIPNFILPKKFQAFYSKHYKDLNFFFKPTIGKRPKSLEIHWKLLDGYMGKLPDYNLLKNHLQPMQFGKIAIEVLEPTFDYFALLSNHFVKDLCNKFKYLIDIGVVLQKNGDQINHAAINDLAAKYGFSKKLQTGLVMMNDLLGINISIQQQKTPIKLRQQYYRQVLLNTINYNLTHITNLVFLKKSMQLQDSMYKKMSFVVRCIYHLLLPTYKDIINAKKPFDRLIFLYLSRPFRLLGVKLNRQAKQKNVEPKT